MIWSKYLLNNVKCYHNTKNDESLGGIEIVQIQFMSVGTSFKIGFSF